MHWIQRNFREIAFWFFLVVVSIVNGQCCYMLLSWYVNVKHNHNNNYRNISCHSFMQYLHVINQYSMHAHVKIILGNSNVHSSHIFTKRERWIAMTTQSFAYSHNEKDMSQLLEVVISQTQGAMYKQQILHT